MLTVILSDPLVGGGKNVLQQIGSKTCHRSPCVWPNSSRAWLSTAIGPGEGTLVRYAASGRVIDRGGSIARSGKDCGSGMVVVALSSDPKQSPGHSFVPLPVPTSLHPIGSFGFTQTSGFCP